MGLINLLIMVGIVLITVIGCVLVMNAFLVSHSEDKISELENYNKICEELDLELLSVSKELFFEDYIICYNESNKETEKIPI